jgi:signal transduction histidine kinase
LHNLDIKTIEEYIDDISNSTNGTLKLLNNLLEWAISQNVGKTFNRDKINLHELLREEIESINTAAK